MIDEIKVLGFLKAIGNLGKYLNWRYQTHLEFQFDRKNNIDTLQTNSSYFDIAQSENTKFAVPYEPIQQDIFKDIITKVHIDYCRYSFIDLGSGKGRALLFASDYQFKNIIGVEFSEELHNIAERNISNFITKNQKNNAFELKCMDVIDYEFPLTNIVVFLYNPFFGEVMETVVNKITNFLTNNEYDLIILYRNPQCANFFDTHLLLTRLHSSKSFNIYRRKIPS